MNTLIKGTISKITFPTTETGEVVMIAWLEENEELSKRECFGLGLKIADYSIQNGKLKIAQDNDVEITFDEKNNITETKILNPRKEKTLIPTYCNTCGKELLKITTRMENKKHHKVESVICRNYRGCTAISTSPIVRLVDLATNGRIIVNEKDLNDFINRYPDSRLQHLSDLKIFMKKDPNTAPRESMWNVEKGWMIEKAVWNYLNRKDIVTSDFWYLCMGNKTITFNPRSVSRYPDLEFPKKISDNIEKINQLIKFLDSFGEKCYLD